MLRRPGPHLLAPEHHLTAEDYAPEPHPLEIPRLNAYGHTRVRFLIPAPDDETPLLNSNDRLNRHAHAKIAAKWRQAGAEIAQDRPPITVPVRVIAYIQKPRAGRYDPNNFWPTAKPILDGMVDAGLLADDDHHHVIGPDMRHGQKGPLALYLDFTPATEGNR